MDYAGRVFAAILVIFILLTIYITPYERALSNEASDMLELRAEEFLQKVCASGRIREDEYGKFLEDLAAIPFAPYGAELAAGVETVWYDGATQSGEPDMSKFPSYACMERVRYTEELTEELRNEGAVSFESGEWVRITITGGRLKRACVCTQVVGG